MKSLAPWEEVTGILSQIRRREDQTVVTVSDTVIAIKNLSLERLDKALNKEVSIVRTESGHRLAINGDER